MSSGSRLKLMTGAKTAANNTRRKKRSREFYDEKDFHSHSRRLQERISKHDLLPASQYSDLFGAVTTSLMRYVDRNDRYKLRYYTQMALERIPFDLNQHMHHVRANLQFICHNHKPNKPKSKAKDLTGGGSSVYIANSPSGQDLQVIASFLGLEIRLVTSFIYEEVISVQPEGFLEPDPIFVAYNDVTKQYVSVVKSSQFTQADVSGHLRHLENVCARFGGVVKNRNYGSIPIFGAIAYSIKSLKRINNNQIATALASLRANLSDGQAEERLAVFIRDTTYQHLSMNANYYDNYLDSADRVYISVNRDCHSIVEYNYYRHQLEKPILHAIANTLGCNIAIFFSNQPINQTPTVISCSLNNDPAHCGVIYLVKNEANQHFDEISTPEGMSSLQDLLLKTAVGQNQDNRQSNRFNANENQRVQQDQPTHLPIGISSTHEGEKKSDLRNKLIRTKEKLITVLSRIMDSNGEPQPEEAVETSEPVFSFDNETKKPPIVTSSSPINLYPKITENRETVFQFPRRSQMFELSKPKATQHKSSNVVHKSDRKSKDLDDDTVTDAVAEKMFQKDLNHTLAKLDSYLNISEDQTPKEQQQQQVQKAVQEPPAIYKTFTIENVDESDEDAKNSQIYGRSNKVGAVDEIFKTQLNEQSVQSHPENKNATAEVGKPYPESQEKPRADFDTSYTSSYNLSSDRISESVINVNPSSAKPNLYVNESYSFDNAEETKKESVNDPSNQPNPKFVDLTDAEKEHRLSRPNPENDTGDVLKHNLTKLNCQLLEFNDIGLDQQKVQQPRTGSLDPPEMNGCLLAIAKSLAYNCSINRDFAVYVNDRLKLHESPSNNYTIDRLARRLHRLCVREWNRNKARYVTYLSNINYDVGVEQFQKTGKCSWALQNAIPLSVANILNLEIQIITSMLHYPVLQIAPEDVVRKDVTLLLAFDQRSGECGRYDAACFNIQSIDSSLITAAGKSKGKTVTFSETPEIRTFQRSDAEKEEILEWQMERNRNRRDKFMPQQQNVRCSRPISTFSPIAQNNFKSMSSGHLIHNPQINNINKVQQQQQQQQQKPMAQSFQQMNFLPFGGGMSQHVNVPMMNVFPNHMMGGRFG